MDNSESAEYNSGSLVSHMLHHLSGLNVATCTGCAGQPRGEGGGQMPQQEELHIAHPKHTGSCEDMLPI